MFIILWLLAGLAIFTASVYDVWNEGQDIKLNGDFLGALFLCLLFGLVGVLFYTGTKLSTKNVIIFKGRKK